MATPDERLLEILASHGPALHRIARAYGSWIDGDEAEDLRQEIVLQLCRSLPSFRGESQAGTWFYRVALNTALSWRRRRLRRAAVEGAHAISTPSHAKPAPAEYVLEEFLSSLSPVDRAVMIPYLDGASHTAIAEISGLSAGAVGVRVHRLRKAFTERYVEDGR